jgi:hypothetical protein
MVEYTWQLCGFGGHTFHTAASLPFLRALLTLGTAFGPGPSPLHGGLGGSPRQRGGHLQGPSLGGAFAAGPRPRKAELNSCTVFAQYRNPAASSPLEPSRGTARPSRLWGTYRPSIFFPFPSDLMYWGQSPGTANVSAARLRRHPQTNLRRRITRKAIGGLWPAESAVGPCGLFSAGTSPRRGGMVGNSERKAIS